MIHYTKRTFFRVENSFFKGEETLIQHSYFHPSQLSIAPGMPLYSWGLFGKVPFHPTKVVRDGRNRQKSLWHYDQTQILTFSKILKRLSRWIFKLSLTKNHLQLIYKHFMKKTPIKLLVWFLWLWRNINMLYPIFYNFSDIVKMGVLSLSLGVKDLYASQNYLNL